VVGVRLGDTLLLGWIFSLALDLVREFVDGCAPKNAIPLGRVVGPVCERGAEVFWLQAGIRLQYLLRGTAGCKESNDGLDRHAHVADTGLAAHHLRVAGNAVYLWHFVIETAPQQ
jgi:hypothetical protein